MSMFGGVYKTFFNVIVNAAGLLEQYPIQAAGLEKYNSIAHLDHERNAQVATGDRACFLVALRLKYQTDDHCLFVLCTYAGNAPVLPQNTCCRGRSGVVPSFTPTDVRWRLEQHDIECHQCSANVWRGCGCSEKSSNAAPG